MTEQNILRTKAKAPHPVGTRDADKEVIQKVRLICSRGNNAEIKQRKDGTLTVMEVKKNIV